MIDKQLTLDRIAAIKNQIIAYEQAIIALNSGIQSYTLDTGQNKTIVTRANIKEIQGSVDALYNRLDVLTARLNGGNCVTVTPGF